MAYQVGPLSVIWSGSSTQINRRQAIDHAIKCSENSPYGLWTSQDEGSDLIAVYVLGQEFSDGR